jgi:hypothetical protein
MGRAITCQLSARLVRDYQPPRSPTAALASAYERLRPHSRGCQPATPARPAEPVPSPLRRAL